MLTQNRFIAQAGERALIWIDPSRVEDHAGTKWPVGKRRWRQIKRFAPKPMAVVIRPMLRSREPFLIPNYHFGDLVPVTDTDRYLRIADFVAKRDTPRATEWFAALSAQLEQEGVAWHKSIAMKDEAQILAFLNDYVGGLIDSLAKNGFRPEHSGYESSAVIGPDGAICKTGSGNHRFNIAKVIGLSKFPLHILGMHEAYFAKHCAGRNPTTDTMLDLIRDVETRNAAPLSDATPLAH